MKKVCFVLLFVFVLFSLRPTPPIGELDLFPLSQDELFRVSLCLGVEIPET